VWCVHYRTRCRSDTTNASGPSISRARAPHHLAPKRSCQKDTSPTYKQALRTQPLTVAGVTSNRLATSSTCRDGVRCRIARSRGLIRTRVVWGGLAVVASPWVAIKRLQATRIVARPRATGMRRRTSSALMSTPGPQWPTCIGTEAFLRHYRRYTAHLSSARRTRMNSYTLQGLEPSA
jgi:hypothetical protein